MDIDTKVTVWAEADIEINTSPEKVWDVLTDFTSWPEWNSGVSDMQFESTVTPGAVFSWKGGGLRIVSTIEEVEPPKRIAWTGKALGTHAIHVYTLTPSEHGVQVNTSESFVGWLPSLLSGYMKATLERSLVSSLQDLKSAAEGV